MAASGEACVTSFTGDVLLYEEDSEDMMKINGGPDNTMCCEGQFLGVRTRWVGVHQKDGVHSWKQTCARETSSKLKIDA